MEIFDTQGIPFSSIPHSFCFGYKSYCICHEVLRQFWSKYLKSADQIWYVSPTYIHIHIMSTVDMVTWCGTVSGKSEQLSIYPTFICLDS